MPFTASIIERSFAYVPDKILKLGGATWLRPLGGPALTAPWERIRIGVLCAVTPNGTANINDVFFPVRSVRGPDQSRFRVYTVSIYWNRLTPTIEISDICVLRFY